MFEDDAVEGRVRGDARALGDWGYSIETRFALRLVGVLATADQIHRIGDEIQDPIRGGGGGGGESAGGNDGHVKRAP